MTIPEATALIEDLEHRPGPESTYRPALETLIADLMEQTYRSTDVTKRVTLAKLETRARLILLRWLKQGTN